MTVHPGLTGERQERLRALFDEAIDLPSSRWSTFVADSAGDDTTIVAELTSLLDSYERSSGFFEHLASQAIATAIAALDEPDERWAAPGRTVLHYELIERIGGGGMGVVYKARDTRLNRVVALKFLPRRYDGDPVASARLLAEARAASALDNPNIGIVYEIAHTEDGRPFIAMAWYDGDTLKSLIRRRLLSIEECIAIGSQLSGALSAAHAAGIIHRDVKPANVIVTRNGTAKLVDFGIAKLATGADDSDAPAAGTIGYMSPEQTRGEPLDFRTDIWSLGVVLHEMATGRRPFRSESDAGVIAQIRSDAAEPVASLRRDAGSSLSTVVARCLAKNRDDRFQSAAELYAALTACRLSRLPRPVTLSRVLAGSAAAAIIVTAVWQLSSRDQPDAVAASGPALSLAVLMPPDPGTADSVHFFADAVADEIRTELERSRLVRLSSPEAAAAHEQPAARTTTLAEKLDADYAVHGRLLPGNERRFHFSLIETKSGRSLLDTTLDASQSSLPGVPRSAALMVLEKLSLRASIEERRRYLTPATRKPLAYELYLRGWAADMAPMAHQIVPRAMVANTREAQAFYAQARSLDPDFAMARARLAATHMASAESYDTTRARREQGRIEAEAALRMDAFAVPAYEALSAYWTQTGKPDSAIAVLQRALRIMPNHVGLLLSLGTRYVSLGRWEDGTAEYQKAIGLDPGNPKAYWLAATSYSRMRRHDAAMLAFTKLLQIVPGNHEIRIIRGHSWLRWKGTADTLLAATNAVPAGWDNRGMKTFARYTGLMVQRQFDEILRMLDASRSRVSTDGLVYHQKDLMRAEAYRGLGDSLNARRHFEAARRQIEARLAVTPGDATLHSTLGLIYGALGRREEALKSADRALQLVPIEASNLAATAHMGLAVETYARIGELDRAFEMIELMLTLPSGREITIPFLEVWPGFDPLRGDPRFPELLKRFPGGSTRETR